MLTIETYMTKHNLTAAAAHYFMNMLSWNSDDYLGTPEQEELIEAGLLRDSVVPTDTGRRSKVFTISTPCPKCGCHSARGNRAKGSLDENTNCKHC